MFIHSQLPEAPVQSQQSRRIQTWWVLKKKTIPVRSDSCNSGYPVRGIYVPAQSIKGFAFFCDEKELDLRNLFCFS